MITRNYELIWRKRLTWLISSHNAMRPLIRTVEHLDRRHAFVFATLSFGVGQLLNGYWPSDNFLAYQLLFIPAVVVAFFETKRFLTSIAEFRVMTASHPNHADGNYIYGLLCSPWYGIALFVVGGLFIYSSVVLKYVAFDPTGLYALLMITLVMVSAILGQICYIYYVLLLRRISTGNSFKYNFYLPSRTNWVLLLDNIGVRLNNAFFVLGVIYTSVYCLNVKHGYLSIGIQHLDLKLSTPNNIAFAASWLVLFGIIIIAFPLYAWLRSTYMDAIVRKLKDISIEEINFLINESGARKDLDSVQKYYRLILDIDGSARRPRDHLNVIPIIATLSSIAVQVISISKSL